MISSQSHTDIIQAVQTFDEQVSLHSQLMQVAEGRGVSGGVDYSYVVEKYRWYASYECRVRCCLLEEEGRMLLTEKFDVHGYRWRMRLKNRQGRLSAYLHSENATRVTVQLEFTAVAAADHESAPRAGGRCTFRWSGDEWGYHNFASILDIVNQSPGHAEDNSFTIRLELRIATAESESGALSVESTSATYIWNLRHVSEMGPSRLATEEITIDNTKLRLMLYLHGRKTRAGDPTIYLCNLGERSILAKCRFTVLNQISSQMDRVEEHSFVVNVGRAKRKGKLLEIRELEDETLGFVRNGWLTVITEIMHLGESCETKLRVAWKRLRFWATRIPKFFWRRR